MVGLVFIETLRLTPVQWAALAFHAAGWVWYYWCSRYGTTPGRADSLSVSSASGTPALPGRSIVCASCCSRPWLLTAILTVSGLWFAFWKTTTWVDMWCLFDQAQKLSPLAWPEVLDCLPKQWYVDKQPPFFTFWVSRRPVLWLHQLLFFPWAILCAGLMWQLYGRNAALLLATPVFALMMHQPSNDVLLFGTLLIVLRLRQLSCLGGKHPPAPLKGGIPAPGPLRQAQDRLSQEGKKTSPPPKGRRKRGCGYRLLAAVIYGLTWMLKPLTILTAPFILPQLGIGGLLSLVMWGGYVSWSLQWEFGRHQLRFLLQQLMLRSLKTSQGGKMSHVPLTLSATLHKLLRKIRGSLRWRWTHLGHKAINALPLYLFPAWLRPWTWRGIVLMGMIILGYGQIKYLLLDLLFLFPVSDEEDVSLAVLFRNTPNG